MKSSFITLFILAATTMCSAGWENIAADTVLLFRPGEKQNNGQGPAFYPMNIFGRPDPNANDSTPITDPRSICSIGLNGVIVVGFTQHVVVDGPGADLMIFENAFRYGTKVYAEPARIFLSKDAVNWVAYPYDATTLFGCAGKTPTSGADPFDPSVSGGDSFDLSLIGIDSVRWVMIEDITDTILNNKLHPFYDPTLTGFDLDAVVSPHAEKAPQTSAAFVHPRSTIVELHIVGEAGQFSVFNLQGMMLSTETVQLGVHLRDMSPYENTCLITRLVVGNEVFISKVLQ